MARIREVDASKAPPEIQKAFEEQVKTFGTVLNPSKIYAHRHAIFFASGVLMRAIDESGLLPLGLRFLVFVRVAQINGCPF